MGLLLLCLGNLAVTLLVAATAVAWAGRWRRRWLAVGFSLLVVLGFLALYAGLAALVGILWKNAGMASMLFGLLLSLTVLFAGGGVWLTVAGLRRGEPGRRRAADWPLARLAALLAVALVLHLTTWWGLELAAEQRTAALRAESALLILAASPPAVPDRDNASFLYSQAAEVAGASGQWIERSSQEWWWFVFKRFEGNRLDTSDAKLRALLKEQADTLDLLHRAASKPSCSFGRPYDQHSLRDTAPDADFVRDGATLLVLDARCKAADGDTRGALRDCLAIFAIAGHLASDRTLISLVCSIQAQRLAVDALEDVVETAPPTSTDLGELDDLGEFSYHEALRRALRTEEALGCQAFCDVGKVLIPLVAPLGAHSAPVPLGHGRWTLPYNIFLRDEDIEVFRELIADEQRITDQPPAQYVAEWEKAGRQAFDFRARSRHGCVAGMLITGLACRTMAITADAERRLALTAVAVCRFRAARGRLPSALAELSPEFLTVIPRDPFDGRPLRMKKTGESLVLYSIGEDGKDDGGIPWNWEKQAGDITFTIKGMPP